MTGQCKESKHDGAVQIVKHDWAGQGGKSMMDGFGISV